MTESTAGAEGWTCTECGEDWPSIDKKVAGGCVACVDVLRYIQYEAPDAGLVHNDVSEVVCLNGDCDERIAVDPATLVLEDTDAVEVVSKEFDPETGDTTGYQRVELYCSPECRNEQYSNPFGEGDADV